MIISNAAFVKNDFNPVDTYGGRAALKIDLNDNWSITPTVVAQDCPRPGRVRLSSPRWATWR